MVGYRCFFSLTEICEESRCYNRLTVVQLSWKGCTKNMRGGGRSDLPRPLTLLPGLQVSHICMRNTEPFEKEDLIPLNTAIQDQSRFKLRRSGKREQQVPWN